MFTLTRLATALLCASTTVGAHPALIRPAIPKVRPPPVAPARGGAYGFGHGGTSPSRPQGGALMPPSAQTKPKPSYKDPFKALEPLWKGVENGLIPSSKDWGSPVTDKPTALTLPASSDHWNTIDWCFRDDPGVCQIGLIMAYGLAYVFDSECKVIGASSGLRNEVDFSLTSQLPWTVEITPRVPFSEFWYAGVFYGGGWDVSVLDDEIEYARLPFDCKTPTE